MKKIHAIGSNHGLRNVAGIAMATALVSVIAFANPAAAQSQAAGDLRTNLTASLAEHTLLAGNATAAILGNRPAEFQAASAALSQNSTKIAGLIGSLYGGNANTNFLPLWQRHIQYYADYANAIKAGDEASRQQATSNLMQWSVDMGALLSSPAQFNSAAGSMQMGSMSSNAGVTQMMQQHVMDTMKVIDAQAANNWPLVYSLAASDVRHMKMVAQDLVNMHSNAAAYQGASTDLKADLAMLLVENAALNANATAALMNNRTAEYQAASAALKDNTAALSSRLGNVYGGNASGNLNGLWNTQSLRLAQYANALSTQDTSTQDAARSNVRGFTANLVTQFDQSNADVPALTLNGWGGTLTTGAINLIDAQRAQNFAREYQLRAQTNQQLLQLTDVLGQSISQQFPTQYGIPSAPAIPANVATTSDSMTASAGTDSATGSATAADASGTTTSSGDASTAGSSVLLPATGADLSSSVYQVTGTTTTTATTGITSTADTTSTGTTTSTTTAGSTSADSTASGSVLLPSTGGDQSQLQQNANLGIIPLLLLVSGIALVAAMILMSIAQRNYRRQNDDQ
jgi:hypothetical protein